MARLVERAGPSEEGGKSAIFHANAIKPRFIYIGCVCQADVWRGQPTARGAKFCAADSLTVVVTTQVVINQKKIRDNPMQPIRGTNARKIGGLSIPFGIA